MAIVDLKIKLDNRQKALLELEGVKDAILEALGQKAEENAIDEVNKAVYDTPLSKSGYIRTGNLRNGISHTKVDDNRVAVGDRVTYAVYVELGTSKMLPRPFIKPALENHKADYKHIIENSLKGK